MAIQKCSNQASRLTERVTFQEPSEAKNSVHEVIKTWSNISTNSTVWAEIQPVNGREYFESQQVRSEKFIKVTIRSRTDLTQKMRLVHNSVNYDIDYIPPNLRGHYITIICHATS